MIANPKFAPRRSDLPYLQRRVRPKVAAPAPAQGSGTGSGSGSGTGSAVSDFLTGRGPRPRRGAGGTTDAAAADTGASTVADFLTHRGPRPRPSTAASVQAPAPAPAPPAPRPTPAPPAPSSSLDLDAPAAPPASAPPPAPAPPGTSSLDLDASQPEPPQEPGPAGAPLGPPRRVRSDQRVRGRSRAILTVTEPTVTLTRVQSGIGTLRFEAVCSDEVGDLRLGAAYQLRSGRSSTVQLTGGNRLAPAKSRRPVIVASHDRYEEIALDLRQCRDLQRLAVYAFSESRSALNWGGTLVMTTFGGARIELPLENLQSGDVAVFVSLYNVHGEFVLRAEMQTLNGGVRAACRAYGYERITWLDDRSTVD